MKITDSSVAMSANHREFIYSHQEAAVIEAQASKDVPSAILSISEEGMSYKEAVSEYERREEQALAERRQQNMANHLKEMIAGTRMSGNVVPDLADEMDYKIKMLRQILAMLRGEKISALERFGGRGAQESRGCGQAQAGGQALASGGIGGMIVGRSGSSAGGSVDVSVGAGKGAGVTVPSNAWQRITVASGYYTETEMTSFTAKGQAHTADGRSIDFNVELNMSRAFTEEVNFMQTELYFVKDPLVINLDASTASVSDQKFWFDLDADGTEEKISFVGDGSGFLAYDKNEDGKINDGSELFGTANGDGFADLARYDEDGNGWIDEGDAVFSKLKVWTRDSEGNDWLIDMKQADVGAIYLGSAHTQYSLKNDAHITDAEIKKTGVYLRESTGLAGTVQHVDLVL